MRQGKRVDADRGNVQARGIPVIFFSNDLDLRFTSLFDAAGILTDDGIKSEHVIGKRHDEIFSPDTAAELMALKEQVIDSGLGVQKRMEVPFASDSRFYDVAIEPMRDAKGKTLGVVGIAIDPELGRQPEEERAEFMRQLVGAHEEECKRISLELHDRTGQQFTALMLLLQSLEPPLGELPDLLGRLKDSLQLAAQIARDMHDLSREICPPGLGDLGLPAVLATEMEEWSRRTGLQAHFHLRGTAPGAQSAEIDLTLYRVIQEALTNILKHAAATQVAVILEYLPDRIRALVEDNGQGFITDSLPGRTGLGLVGMRERLALVSGRLDIESIPGSGTTIRIEVPSPKDPPDQTTA